jgi:hypothetical protein
VEAVIFTKSTWTALSNANYPLVDQSLAIAIPTQDYLWSLATSAEFTPYLSQLHGSQFLNVDLQT